MMRSLILLVLIFASNIYGQQWSPVDVYGITSIGGQLEKSNITFHSLKEADKSWKICIVIPHLKDPFWSAVNYALIDEAKRLDLRIRIKEAGGYGRLRVQRQQIVDCVNNGAQGLLVASVSRNGLNDLVKKYSRQGIPIIDMINGIDSQYISARVTSLKSNNIKLLLDFLKQHSAGKGGNVLWLPGPKGSAWSENANESFKALIKTSSLNLLDTLWGDTGREQQASLIKSAIKQYKKIDYIIGTAIAAEAALDIITQYDLLKNIKILAYSYGPGVHRGISREKILAATSDKQGTQARLAINVLVQALQGSLVYRHIAVKAEMVNEATFNSFQRSTSIAPKGFRPVFSVNDWVNNK